jgi:catechol 2,3-dioxygenase-like lactoylglutathione lyase family enzyme
MIDPNQIYHVGVVVQDLDRAMDDLSTALGYNWTAVRTMNTSVLLPSGSPAPISLRLAFTKQGPPWLEFIEGPAGSVWSAAGGNMLHHVAFYVDDLEAERQRMESLGMAFEVGGMGPDGRLSGFAYHLNPHGGRVELVEARLRDGMERWLSEGI